MLGVTSGCAPTPSYHPTCMLQTALARTAEDRAKVDLKLHFMPKTLNEVDKKLNRTRRDLLHEQYVEGMRGGGQGQTKAGFKVRVIQPRHFSWAVVTVNASLAPAASASWYVGVAGHSISRLPAGAAVCHLAAQTLQGRPLGYQEQQGAYSRDAWQVSSLFGHQEQANKQDLFAGGLTSSAAPPVHPCTVLHSQRMLHCQV